MDQTGLLDRIFEAAQYIDFGRKGFTTDGQEHEGRLNYEKGISASLSAFMEAEAVADPKMLILAEITFLQQELRFCNDTDTITQNSLTQAIQSFEDARRCLVTVEDSALYRAAETTHPTADRYRVRNFPKDAFHLACISHRTRLKNVQRAPGINMIEKAVLEQRTANMKTAQDRYVKKQRAALGGDDNQD